MAAGPRHAPPESGRPDPLLGAVGEDLVLPDRHLGLEGVDEVTGRVERLPAMRCRRRDDHGQVTDLEPPDAVHGGDPSYVVGSGHLAADVRKALGGGGMGGVVEGDDGLAEVVVADLPDEEDQPTRSVVVERGHHLGHVEGGVADVDQAYGIAHLRECMPVACWVALSTVALMSSTPGGDRDDDFNPFKGTPFEQLFGGLAGGMGGAGGAMPDLNSLMQQMQSLFQPHDGPVNWETVTDMARKVTAQQPDPSPTRAQADAIADSVRLADHWLDTVTDFPSGVTTTAAWSRADWIVQTVDVWKVLVEPIAGSATAAIEQAMPEEMRKMAGPLLSLLARAGGAMVASQVGNGLGTLAGEVISASDIGLPLGPSGTAALLPANVAKFSEELPDVSDDDVLLYLSLREAAHQRLFAGVPWLRDHLISAVSAYGAGVDIDTSGMEEKLRGFDPTNPEAMQEAMSGGMFDLEPSPAQKAALEQLEVTLALVEGWVDEVVGQATVERMPTHAKLQEAVRRRRATGGPAEQTFSSLVGLELRPRRLRDASTLWGSLRTRQGTEGRDGVWMSPHLLPTATDLDDPLGFREDSVTPETLSEEEFDAGLRDLLDGGTDDRPTE
jgi:putative hydrolase